MDKRAFDLNDKYTLTEGKIYLTGIQALARLSLMQKQRDLESGLNTAGFISGYRGSPLGGLDQALWSIDDQLKQNNIVFQPGINEDLAATAVWGTQQLNLFPGANHEGVFALWYGKGPGVDRSGDVFKHANASGTSPLGGVLLCMGDDHTAKSSTLPHQSEFALLDAGIPFLNPASIQEVLDYGLYGWAMSRYSGCWVGLKTLSETMDSSSSVSADNHRVQIIKPHNFSIPETGLHTRLDDTPLAQEARLHQHKLFAAMAFAQANSLNRIIIDSPQPRLGIITTGKSYLDVRQALLDLGIDHKMAYDVGIRLYKIAMPWPLDKQGVREFARGLDEILVVEEKRAFIENQIKEQLYNWDEQTRPRIIGKYDEKGVSLLPAMDELTPARIARVIAERIGRYITSSTIRQRLAFLEEKEKSLQSQTINLIRKPHFCSGCPHNTSTRVPEGSRATAGIGCHYMVRWMDRDTNTFTQMGGEGAPWTGQAPFSQTEHIYVNLGDGTYFHSGSLAIRAAIAAGVNMTYKLLYNGAVAMTGGQALDGELSLPQLVRQLLAEGVKRVVVVSDRADSLRKTSAIPTEVEIHARKEFDRVQTSLREIKGVSVLVYDQMCATEKRRQIKRGKQPASRRFAYINADVCEDCGDCSRKSNCLAVIPRRTPAGKKRRIDQAACNHDFSCLQGYCPSFVLVDGQRKKPASRPLVFDVNTLPEPTLPRLEQPYAIVITGVGGTGIVTLSAILGVAAHLEDKGVKVLDMTGLAQKFGAVGSHIQISQKSDDLCSSRIAAGNADLLLGCDAVTSSSADTLAKLDRKHSRAVINSHQTVTSDYLHDSDTLFPERQIRSLILNSVLPGQAWFFDSIRIARKACGDPIASNMLMVGYAWQKGLIPLSRRAILEAIQLNGVAVEMNINAFNWGRCLADNVSEVLQQLGLEPIAQPDLDELIADRAEQLTRYQGKPLADRYLHRINTLRNTEGDATASETLTLVAARQYARLLMIKDEYEVARLLTSATFRGELKQQFESGYRVNYLLAPPALGGLWRGAKQPPKMRFGPWLEPILRLMSRVRHTRNSWLDPFRYSAERKRNLALLDTFEALLDKVVDELSADNYASFMEKIQSVEGVRGFGDLRKQHIRQFIEN